MEAAAILHMAINSVSERKFVMRWIVADDDSVMCAYLRHPKDTPKDKGKLPIWVFEPEFMADPGHRKKSVSKHFYKLASVPVGKSRASKNMAKRIKKNWGYMIRQNKGKSIEEFVKSSNAPLEHMFDNHVYCDPEWCGSLQAKAEGLPYNHPAKFCTRTTIDGEKMYQDLLLITMKYGCVFF